MHDADAAAMARRDALFALGFRLCHACDGVGRALPDRCDVCENATWVGPGGGPRNPDRVSDLLKDRDAEIVALYATGDYTQRDLGEMFNLRQPRVGLIIRQARRQGSL
jgi:hypothetical protein